MSATFHLYEIDKEVHFKGSKYYSSTKEERDTIHNLSREDFDDFLKKIFEKNGEIVEGWDYIDVTYLRQFTKISPFKRCKLFSKYIKKLRTLGTDRIPTFMGELEALPVKEVLYRQGWFVSKKFLNKTCTWYYATTKKELEHFFDLYLDVKGDDKRGLEAKNAFLSAWKDRMLFEAAF